MPLFASYRNLSAQVATLKSQINAVIASVATINTNSSGSSSRNINLLNLLVYSVSNASDYSYYQGNTMQKLFDGDSGSGMMAFTPAGSSQGVGRIYVRIPLEAASFLNRIEVFAGQFNGTYNIPSGIEIYRGLVTDTTTPFYTASLANSLDKQTFDLTAITALNTSLTQITIAFTYDMQTGNSRTVSINEIVLKGYVA